MISLPQNVFTVSEQHDRLVIRLDTDGFRYPDLQQEANRVTGHIHSTRPTHVVIDLAGVLHMNSITISVIVRVAREAGACGANVSLCNGAESVLEILRTMNLTRLWPHYESFEAAVASVES